MSDCCNTSAGGFPDSSNMTNMSTNWSTVWAEISVIQQSILNAASQCPFPCNGQGGTPGTGGNLSICVGGTSPMTFTSGITAVNVINGGSGYYADLPMVKFIPPYGTVISPVDIATATLNTNGSSILSVSVNPGSAGYQPVYTTAQISSLTGSGAQLLVTTSASGEIYGISVVSPGSGYLITDVVNIIRAIAPNIAYTNAVALISGVDISGGILSISVTTPGTGYQPSVTTIEIVSSLNPTIPYPGASGFNSVVFTDLSGQITSVTVLNGGFGYSTLLPQLVVNDPGSGVSATVTLDGALIVSPGNAVQSITVNISGNNYTESATGSIVNPSTAPSPSIPAQLQLILPVNTFCTHPNLYYQVWTGTVINRAILNQLDFVKAYFTNLGYSVRLGTNPDTGSTLEWCICW